MNHPLLPIKCYVGFTGSYDSKKHMASIVGWHVPLEDEEPFEPHWEAIVQVPWEQRIDVLGAIAASWDAIIPVVLQKMVFEMAGQEPQDAWDRAVLWHKRLREIGEP